MAGDVVEARDSRRVHWWLFALILLAGAALLGGLQMPDLFPDDAHRNLATISATLLVTGLLTLWAIFGTGLARSTQVRLFLAAIAAAVSLMVCFRVEGFSGNLTPRVTWRWAAKPDASLVHQKTAVDPVGEAGHADLTQSSDHDFPQFLGPHRDATVELPNFELDWNKHRPHERWRKPIGAGWSAFAVVGEYALTQEQRGEDECVTCYDLKTGELLWLHSDPGRFSHPLSGDGPRSTPTIDEGRVYTLGAFGRLNCLDGRSGDVLWTHDIIDENQASNLQWGKSCSPLIVDNVVVVSAGGKRDRSLIAYDKVTGEIVWHAGTRPSSYASPRLMELAGTRQVVIVNRDAVTGHAADDGHVLWEFEWPGDEPKVADAVAVDEKRIFIAAGYGLGCKLLQISQAGDDAPVAKVLWQNKSLKLKFTNVVVRDGFVYGLDDGRALVCLDLKDGKRRWRGGRYGHGQVLLVNDVLLVQAESGEVALVEASPEGFNELTRFAALDGQTWNNPVVSGRVLLVRNATEAACYELPSGSAADPAIRQPAEERKQHEDRAVGEEPAPAAIRPSGHGHHFDFGR